MIAIPPRRYNPQRKAAKAYIAHHDLFHIQVPHYTLNCYGETFHRYLVRHETIDKYRRYVWAPSQLEAIAYVSKHSGFNPEELFAEDNPFILNLSFQRITEEDEIV